ncbi:MAG: hypothetical protein OEM63_13145 [Gammaproteobacteria bacterium]|nr:hypothetical protein [Gammaproteobacteria bacterium]
MRRAIVVFPHSGLHGALTDRQRRWMSRGRVRLKPVASEPLNDVLLEIGMPCVSSGLAALRFLGHTGQSAESWIAAADPVSFEPRLRDIVARRIPPGQLADSDLPSLIAAAQEMFVDEYGIEFECMGNLGYLKSTDSMSTSKISATALHGFGPDAYLPAGDTGRSFHRIHGELQMLFHDHAVNRQRAEQGLPPINGLWIWGGGRLPEKGQQNLPTLFSNDPLFAGYWRYFGGDCRPWNGNIGECIDAARGTVVVTAPEPGNGVFDQAALELLDELRDLLKYRRVTHFTLIFNNEVIADLRWSDRVRFWRHQSVLNPEHEQND